MNAKTRNALSKWVPIGVAPALIIALMLVFTGTSFAIVTTPILRQCVPANVGNGYALAFDPGAGRLFYTNLGDSHVYIADTNCGSLGTLQPKIDGTTATWTYGGLAWLGGPNGGGLEGGRYDGSGRVDKINSQTGVGKAGFAFAFPAHDTCFSLPAGYVDGVAFDINGTQLWISDHGGKHLYHVTFGGKLLKKTPTYENSCNTGIAFNNKDRLWVGVLTGSGPTPSSIVAVELAVPFVSPTGEQFLFSVHNPGLEGVAFDNVTFAPKCALWTNESDSTKLTAWQVPCDTGGGGSAAPIKN